MKSGGLSVLCGRARKSLRWDRITILLQLFGCTGQSMKQYIRTNHNRQPTFFTHQGNVLMKVLVDVPRIFPVIANNQFLDAFLVADLAVKCCGNSEPVKRIHSTCFLSRRMAAGLYALRFFFQPSGQMPH
jgi:hypothetical protein